MAFSGPFSRSRSKTRSHAQIRPPLASPQARLMQGRNVAHVNRASRPVVISGRGRDAGVAFGARVDSRSRSAGHGSTGARQHMRKFIVPAAAVVVVAGAAHVGISHWIGGALADETQALQRRLLAIEGVSVRNLTYEKRLFDGELAFDLAWRPPQRHPLREAMELSGRRELSFSGRAPVRHGPWAGGFGVARSEATLPLPEEMRAYLPKYPGQSPWLRLDGFVDWSRRLTVDFRVIDYAGA
ncbi:MAG: DUF945 family protein, partial [Alphaproteobacteria bacterium]|nr:DUF945 family protein [Alphaproteobacteria bacterium]